MDVSVDDLVGALRSQGLRVTKPRRAVCSILTGTHGQHLTASDIHRRVEALEGGPIDQSTVYRTIDTLEEAGLLTHTHLGQGALVYHLTNEAAHQHLMCRRCARTMGIRATEFEAFYTEITRLTGFVVEPTHGVIWGLCADCTGSEA
ncbi:MAG: Fur family transcriptional regulator [Acidimicrobiia bacterium]